MPKLKDIFRHPKKIAKYIPAIIGTIGGTALGGPLGGIAGGALGGASTRGKGNKLKGALKGAGIGTIYAAGAPALFHSLGGAPGGLASTLTGAHGPSLLNQLGMSSAPKMGGGLGFYGNAGQKGIFQGAGGIKGMTSKIPGSKYLMPSIMQTLGKRTRQEQMGQSHEEGPDTYGFSRGLVNPIQPVPIQQRENPAKAEESKRVSEIVNNPRLSALDKLMQILQILEAEKPGEQSAQQAQNLEREEVPHEAYDAEEYKRGGYVEGDSGGQDDDAPRGLSEGDYVMDATTVSLQGDGNSHNGKKQMKQMEDKFLKTGIVRNPSRNYNVRTVKAKVSPGEYIISKEAVDAAGGGDNKKGAKFFDKYRHNLRSHKGVKKFLPPKSKPISHYLGKTRAR